MSLKISFLFFFFPKDLGPVSGGHEKENFHKNIAFMERR
jgi:hypothetical protein